MRRSGCWGGWGGMDDERLDCEFLNLLKWTEVVGLMLGLVEDEGLAVRVVERGLGVDLMLTGMLRSGSEKSMTLRQLVVELAEEGLVLLKGNSC